LEASFAFVSGVISFGGRRGSRLLNTGPDVVDVVVVVVTDAVPVSVDVVVSWDGEVGDAVSCCIMRDTGGPNRLT
jgi:hypothetical protein